MANENVSFLGKFSLSVEELWKNHKLFLLIFGIILVVVKFRDVLTAILLASARQIFQNAQNKDASLAAQEDDAKRQADELVKKAKEPPKGTPSDDDWYKK